MARKGRRLRDELWGNLRFYSHGRGSGQHDDKWKNAGVFMTQSVTLHSYTVMASTETLSPKIIDWSIHSGRPNCYGVSVSGVSCVSGHRLTPEVP